MRAGTGVAICAAISAKVCACLDVHSGLDPTGVVPGNVQRTCCVGTHAGLGRGVGA
jgi:hypothetical protein